MRGADAVGPSRFDVIENSFDILVRQTVAESRHAGGEGNAHFVKDRLPAAFDVVAQHDVAVMPGVAARVMRRGGIGPVLIRRPPVGMSFQIGAVARRAFRFIDGATLFEIGAIVEERVRLRCKQQKDCRARNNRSASELAISWLGGLHVRLTVIGVTPSGGRIRSDS